MISEQPVWPPPAAENDARETARIIVSAGFFPLAFIYAFFTPTITLNGRAERRPWGTHAFDVTPGDYAVSVSYPWLFVQECGKNSVRFTISAGQIKTVTYRAGLIRYLPGSIRIH